MCNKYICPFCKHDGEKVKAHIIPKAFFKALSKDKSVLQQRELNLHPVRVPIGIYDDCIWCKSCEKDYGRWDDYAAKVLLQSPIENFESLPSAYELPIDDRNGIKKLRLFFISLLWRASFLNKRIYKNVSIGSLFAEKAKALLTSDEFINVFQDDFSTIISYSGADESLIAEPVTCKIYNVLFYKFYLGRFIVYIKVSSQPVPKVLLPTVIGQKDALIIVRTKRDDDIFHLASKIAKETACRAIMRGKPMKLD